MMSSYGERCEQSLSFVAPGKSYVRLSLSPEACTGESCLRRLRVKSGSLTPESRFYSRIQSGGCCSSKRRLLLLQNTIRWTLLL